MRLNFNILLKLAVIFALTFFFYLSYLNFKSMVAHMKIKDDIYAAQPSLTYLDIDEILPKYPNITNNTFPVDSYRAYYYYLGNLTTKANELLKESYKINPHLYFSEHLLSRFYMMENNLDSAYYYANKAFYGWPKTFKHYEVYNDVLILKNDKEEILNAYGSISNKFINRKEYHKDFIASIAELKMNDLVVYDSIIPLNKNFLIGKWKEVLEYENYDPYFFEGTDISFKNDGTVNVKEGSYIFKLFKDSLFLYPLNNLEYAISKNKIVRDGKRNVIIITPSQSNGYKRPKILKRID